MDFYGKQTIKSIILMETHSERHLTHGNGIYCINYCKIIDKKHGVLDAIFGY